jgi:hypothetical protein
MFSGIVFMNRHDSFKLYNVFQQAIAVDDCRAVLYHEYTAPHGAVYAEVSILQLANPDRRNRD